MRAINSIVFSIILFGTFSCLPPVVFTESQPKGYHAKNSFSNYYQGTFFSEFDNTLIKVTETAIYKEKAFPVGIPVSQVDTVEGVRLIGDQLYIINMEGPVPYYLRNDSIITEVLLRDTLFDIRENNILTQFKGHQILNKKMENGDWEVLILSLDQNFDLILSLATVPEDLERLKEITPVTEIQSGDTLRYRISPNVFEFNIILKEKLVFKPGEIFIRKRMPLTI